MPYLARLIAPLILSLALATSVGWLLGSTAGVQALARLAPVLSSGQLSLTPNAGRLLGPITISRLTWRSSSLSLTADDMHLDWSPGALLEGRLHVLTLDIGRLEILSQPEPSPTPVPATLRLPLAVDLDKLAITTLSIRGLPDIRQLDARFHSDGRQHQLQQLALHSGDIRLSGQAELDGAAPLPLSARVQIEGRLEQRPLALDLAAHGPLAGFRLEAQAHAGLRGQLHAEITPFAAAPFSRAQLALRDLDPAAWTADAPTARIDLEADLQPAGSGVSGMLKLLNHQPGPLDQNRLPIADASGQLDWQGSAAKITRLRIRQPGSGELQGEAGWQADALELSLNARRLDAAKIHSRLRSTALDGPLSTRIEQQAQSLRIDLSDKQFRLQGDLRHSAGHLDISQLTLAAGPARLSTHGQLAFNRTRPFNLNGTLSQFDPARFARVPSAQINANLSASGQLAAPVKIDARFDVHDSRLAGQPLTGHGELKLDGEHLQHTDIRLQAGDNLFAANGAFGHPGDRLNIDIDARQLAPYGLAGNLNGRLGLSGTRQQPTLDARLTSSRLDLPGALQLRGLQLETRLAAPRDAPLHIALTIDRVDQAELPGLLRQFSLRSEGQTGQHRIHLSTEVDRKDRLHLSAEGGLSLGTAWRWQGRLLELAARSPQSSRQFQLAAPAAVDIGAQGWQLAPLALRGDPLDWLATLQARADQQVFTASLQAQGSRIGHLDASLMVGLSSPWQPDRQRPWQGRAQTRIDDLGWLGELIGDGWQSGGRAEGELNLSGTPGAPLINGRLRGEQLALRLPEHGLSLSRGELAVDIERNLLRVRQLGFDSPWQPLPRALQLAGGEQTGELVSRPGRLEISGQMRVDRNTEDAWLDLSLDRLGATQLTDQWLSVSGKGRLSWQAGTLGARGRFVVDAGYWQLAPGGAPRLSDDVIVRRPGRETSTPLRPKLDLDVTTDFGNLFLFSGAGLNSRLSGEVRLRASGRDLPRASGTIRTRDGRFEAYGQKLEIERGILNFQGLPDNPGLDVRAVRKGLPVEPGVQIGGSAQRPVVKLISDPALPEAEKLAWLVLGHGSDQMSAGDTTTLLSAAGGLLGNDSTNLVQQLKKTFGLDEFGVRQGNLGDTGSRRQGSRIANSNSDTSATTGNQIFSVGKRLSSNALLSYEQALGKAESIVKLTVNLSRRIAVIGRAGSDNALDVFWTTRFGGPPPAETGSVPPNKP